MTAWLVAIGCGCAGVLQAGFIARGLPRNPDTVARGLPRNPGATWFVLRFALLAVVFTLAARSGMILPAFLGWALGFALSCVWRYRRLA